MCNPRKLYFWKAEYRGTLLYTFHCHCLHKDHMTHSFGWTSENLSIFKTQSSVGSCNLWQALQKRCLESHLCLAIVSCLFRFKPENLTHKSRSIEQLFDAKLSRGAEKCISILVETGVYSRENDQSVNLNHLPRDFLPVEENFLIPSITVPHISKAVEAIFECEEFTWPII